MKFSFTKVQEKWLQTLESGKLPQGTGSLVGDDGYCCLGVACEILRLKRVADFGGFWSSTRNKDRHYMPGNSWRKLGLRNSMGVLEVSVNLSKVTVKKVD